MVVMKECDDVLGLDPGKVNYAWARVDLRGRVVAAGFFARTITSMARAERAQVKSCLDGLRELVRQSRARTVAVEQFAARQFGTSLSQYVNTMQGLLMAACDEQDVECHSVMPSTWKNAIRALGDLESLYRYAKSLKVPPHVVDASCIGLYVRRNFKFLPSDKLVIETNVRRCAKFASVTNALPVRPKAKRRKRRVRK